MEFPRILPIWRPPLSSSPIWHTQAIELDGPADPNDILAVIALILRYHGNPHSATFYIVLPCCLVQVVYPSDSALSLAYWRPRLVYSSIRALVAVRLNHSLSSHDLVELAVSLSVPLLISQRSSASSVYMEATFDDSVVSRAEAAWLLIHLKNALHSLQSRDLISNLPIFGAIERYLFFNRFLTRRLPPWLLVRLTNALWSLRVQSNHFKVTDIPLVSTPERYLLGGDVAPRGRARFPNMHSRNLHDIFLERARADPLSIAIRYHHTSNTTTSIVEITYASCHAIALRLTLILQSFDVRAHSVVPIILVHPVDIAISMIAVLLAGATYAIMDPKTLDTAGLQECLSLGQVRSPLVLLHHALRERVSCVDVKSIDPRHIVQNSLQNPQQPWEFDSAAVLPSVVGGDMAFVASSSHGWESSVVRCITHSDAFNLLQAQFERLEVVSTSKVLLTNDCPLVLFQGIVWNVLAVLTSISIGSHVVCPYCPFTSMVKPFVQLKILTMTPRSSERCTTCNAHIWLCLYLS